MRPELRRLEWVEAAPATFGSMGRDRAAHLIMQGAAIFFHPSEGAITSEEEEISEFCFR